MPSVPLLLDMLELFYWQQPSGAAFGKAPLRHARTGEVIGERPGPFLDGASSYRLRLWHAPSVDGR